MTNNPNISFIVPVYNEEKNVTKLHEEILSVAKKMKKTFEIIFVDDGSRDGTAKVLRKLKPITIVTLRKNFGQTAALDAGIKQAEGDLLVTLDGDGQNDPADVPKMLENLEKQQLDVVCGWRKDRKDSASKKLISKGAKWMRTFLVHDRVHDAGCTLRVYKNQCFSDLNLRGEMHRFIPALLMWRGFRVGEMHVNHRFREHGVSKYDYRRTLKGFLDMMSIWFFRKFSSRPLHLLGALGMFVFLIGFGLGLFMFLGKLIQDVSLSNKIWPLASVFLMLFGVQMFVSGLIMDLVIGSSNTQHYFVREVQANTE